MGSFFPGVIINFQHPGENMENGSHSPISFKYSSRFSFFCSTQTPATEFSISARAMFVAMSVEGLRYKGPAHGHCPRRSDVIVWPSGDRTTGVIKWDNDVGDRRTAEFNTK